jgi:hypothetical protein
VSRINLTAKVPVKNAPGRRFMNSLSVGDGVGLHYEMEGCAIYSNGIVAAVEDGQVWGEFARAVGFHRRFLDRPRKPYSIVPGPRLTRASQQKLTVGWPIQVYELYPDGRQVVIHGTVTVVQSENYRVGELWLDYKPTNVQVKVFGGNGPNGGR